MTSRKRRAAGLAWGMLAVFGAMGIARGAGGTGASAGGMTQKDIDDQYHDVITQMKSPMATGVLVTEVAPEVSATKAQAERLRAGDIITHFNGQAVRTLDAIREKMADALGLAVTTEQPQTIALTVRRVGAAKPVVLTLPAEPMAVRAIEVEAAAPAAMNPPASVRKAFAMKWAELLASQGPRTTEGGASIVPQEAFYRVEAEGTAGLLAWQSRSIAVESGDVVKVVVATHRVANLNEMPTLVGSDTVTVSLRTGDFQSAPAFVAESLEVISEAMDGARVVTTLNREGAKLNGQRKTFTTSPDQHPEPPADLHGELISGSIPAVAVPVIAGAMPIEKAGGGDALAIELLSAADGLSRPGYVLITRGPQGNGELRVDLMHCGVVVEAYFFTGDRALVRAESRAGTNFITRRVNSEEDAKSAVTQKPPPSIFAPPGGISAPSSAPLTPATTRP